MRSEWQTVHEYANGRRGRNTSSALFFWLIRSIGSAVVIGPVTNSRSLLTQDEEKVFLAAGTPIESLKKDFNVIGQDLRKSLKSMELTKENAHN